MGGLEIKIKKTTIDCQFFTSYLWGFETFIGQQYLNLSIR